MKFIDEKNLNRNLIDLKLLELDLIFDLLTSSNFTHKERDNQTWLQILNGKLLTDEIVSEDQETVFPHHYNYRVIKFYQSAFGFKLDSHLFDIFFELNESLSQIKGLEYIHIHSMKNMLIDCHTDGNLVLIKNLNCPTSVSLDQFGIKIGDHVFQPETGYDIWLDTNLVHSVWNSSNQEWKFLAISLDRNYIKDL